MDIDDCPLPDDGFPRITTEGVAILREGLAGDFTRWLWGIGNHPLEIPLRETRNLVIRAMKDEPHFYATFWFGHYYPQTKKYKVLTPWFCFDQLDTYLSEHSPEEYTDTVHLRQTSDYWSDLTILMNDNDKCGT